MTVKRSRNKIVSRFHEESTAGLAEGTQKRLSPLLFQRIDFSSYLLAASRAAYSARMRLSSSI